MSKKLHTILNEKYRPDTLEGYICKDEIKTKFDEFIKNQDIPHLLFAGKPGAGKTTIASTHERQSYIVFEVEGPPEMVSFQILFSFFTK